MKDELREYIEGWLRKAENDLIAAQRLIEIEPMILDTACFHCQQAIEKFLKAFLIFNMQDIRKTHDIDFLLSECEKIDLIFGEIDTKDINVYAVRIRYPDDVIMPELSETKDYYQLALKIKDIVSRKINL